MHAMFMGWNENSSGERDLGKYVAELYTRSAYVVTVGMCYSAQKLEYTCFSLQL